MHSQYTVSVASFLLQLGAVNISTPEYVIVDEAGGWKLPQAKVAPPVTVPKGECDARMCCSKCSGLIEGILSRLFL